MDRQALEEMHHFYLLRDYDRFILITETEIEEALKYLYDTHQLVVEGAAGVAMAAAMKDPRRHSDDVSVIILCGGNISLSDHQRICGY